MKDSESSQEIGIAGAVLDYVVAAEQAEGVKAQIATLESQRAQRVELMGSVLQRQRQIEAGIKLLEDELRQRTEQMAVLDQKIEATRKDEPVLFGKDEWRANMAALEEQRKGLQDAYTHRLGTLNGLKIDHSSVSVEVQTAQAQQGLVERQIAEGHAKLGALENALRELGNKLGSSRPARAVSVDDARKAVGELQQVKLDVAKRMDQIKAEMRRQKDEAVRLLGRVKQIAMERQHMTAMVESAEVAATQGREEALRQLALNRRAGVERHVGEVLGTLEKSLSLIVPTFVDPVRDVLMKATEPRAEVSQRVLEAADAVAPVVEKLAKELDLELLAQDATLGQVQREFCDVALEACKTAWTG
jgi:chromosome segregation ATPase